MSFIIFLKGLITAARQFFAAQIRIAQLRKQNPTCRFYGGVSIDGQSSLGKYNVVFQNAAICNSQIGDHTYIQKNSSINFANVGKFCSIAANVTIGLGSHPMDQVSTHPAFYSATQPVAKHFAKTDLFDPFRKTVVGHDVWIGQNAMIKDGLKIGTGAVIAAGALVTKDVEDYAIVAGVPAKIIRYRFDEVTRKKLLESKWWDWPEKDIEIKHEHWNDPLEFSRLL